MRSEAPIRVTVLSPGCDVGVDQLRAWLSAEVAAIDDLMEKGRHRYHGSLIHLFLSDSLRCGDSSDNNIAKILHDLTGKPGCIHRIFVHAVREPLTAEQKEMALAAVRADLESVAAAYEGRNSPSERH